MSRLPLLSIEEAPVEVQSSLKFFEDRAGYLPNLLRILANAPAALESYLTVWENQCQGIVRCCGERGNPNHRRGDPWLRILRCRAHSRGV